MIQEVFICSFSEENLILLHSQVVANCLSALQEIWSLEGSASEEVSREREILLSKSVIYYLLNRYFSMSGPF